MGKEKIIIGSSSGANYTIEKVIGRGGQGKVYAIKGGVYAFKLLGKKTSSNAEFLKRKMSYLKTRPLEGLPISMPLEQIEGKGLGYIMEMATNMMSLDKLIKLDAGKDFKSWWSDTGGLKKRILVLKGIADTLAKLHSRGLVYGDFSFNNIFVSENKKYSEIFFIDSDNITHNSKVGSAVYTPGYAAPELIVMDNHPATSGYDTFTDDFSFALIAYQLLTLTHPFIGDYVNGGEPELEEKAYLGKIPWVNHSSDNQNRTKAGIPISLTISKKMMDAFQQTFEIGITHKTNRTSASKWQEILAGASDAIIVCENPLCNQSFFYSKSLKCPFCNGQMPFVGFAQIHPFIKGLKDEVQRESSVNLVGAIHIGKLMVQKKMTPDTYLILKSNDFFSDSSNRELFKIKLKDDTVFVKGIELSSITVISNNKYKEKVDIRTEKKIALNGPLLFMLNEVDQYQRILKIKKYSR